MFGYSSTRCCWASLNSMSMVDLLSFILPTQTLPQQPRFGWAGLDPFCRRDHNPPTLVKAVSASRHRHGKDSRHGSLVSAALVTPRAFSGAGSEDRAGYDAVAGLLGNHHAD